jgi:hypothetical protein
VNGDVNVYYRKHLVYIEGDSSVVNMIDLFYHEEKWPVWSVHANFRVLLSPPSPDPKKTA